MFVSELKSALRAPVATWSFDGDRVLAKAELAPGALIATLNPETLGRSNGPLPGARQVDLMAYVSDPAMLSRIRHSCDPNSHFVADELAVYAARPILPGSEITIFYPSSDWELSQGFNCNCGSRGCLGKITGACDLPAEVLRRYYLNPVVAGLSLGLKPLLAR